MDLDDDLKVEVQQKLAGKTFSGVKRRFNQREPNQSVLVAEEADALEKAMFPQKDDNIDKTKTKDQQR